MKHHTCERMPYAAHVIIPEYYQRKFGEANLTVGYENGISGEAWFSIDIFYCPFCGQKLEED